MDLKLVKEFIESQEYKKSVNQIATSASITIIKWTLAIFIALGLPLIGFHSLRNQFMNTSYPYQIDSVS